MWTASSAARLSPAACRERYARSLVGPWSSKPFIFRALAKTYGVGVPAAALRSCDATCRL
jgi:hypothetical protein